MPVEVSDGDAEAADPDGGSLTSADDLAAAEGGLAAAVARRFCRPQAAEYGDVLGEAWLAILKACRRHRGGRSWPGSGSVPWRVFLAMAARYAAEKAYYRWHRRGFVGKALAGGRRARGWRPPFADNPDGWDFLPGGADPAAAADAADELARVLRDLPPDLADDLLAYHGRGEQQIEIAARRGLNKFSLCRRLNRTVAELRAAANHPA